MNHSLNGNGNGISDLKRRPKPELTKAQVSTTLSGTSETQVVFQTAEGVTLRGIPLRIKRHSLVFELYDPGWEPQLSECLRCFQVVGSDGVLYAGRAVVRNVVSDGIKVTHEVNLDEHSWADFTFAKGHNNKQGIQSGFKCFLLDWQQAYYVREDYKVAIADLQTFMMQLRLWLDQAELKIGLAPKADRDRQENKIVEELRDSVIAALNSLFERFEIVSEKIDPELLPFHRAYGRLNLHSLILGSPFMHRTYTKPLGYAGDYEMMSMIVRNGLEGQSAFAKLINAHLLDQPPCRAVRNRVDFLNARIIEEVSRVARQRQGDKAKIFCVACGPAWEVVNFVAEHPLANQAQITLLDFNEETLRDTGNKISETIRKHQRRTQVKLIKNSVQNLLRAKHKKTAEYDLIYCSGLYDYLSDTVCLALNTLLYDMLAPGGMLVVGNFAKDTAGRNLMEHLMDWFLIYRNQQELLELAPKQMARENCRVRCEAAAANLFLEARKPQ